MVKPGQGAGLVQEPGQPPVVVLGIRVGFGYYRAGFRARGKLPGQVLLDGHEHVQVGIVCPVGDAEPPGPQHRIEPVFLKAGAGRQGMDMVDGHGRMQVPDCSG